LDLENGVDDFHLLACWFPVSCGLLRDHIGVTLSVGIFMMTIVLQFVAIFWFLKQSRTYESCGYRGRELCRLQRTAELLEQARQVVTLLRGVKTFEDAGGEPLTGVSAGRPPRYWQNVAGKSHQPPFKLVCPFICRYSSLQGMFMGQAR